MDIEASEDRRVDANGQPETAIQRGSREINLGSRKAEDVWALMRQHAENIGSAQLDYNFGQNSNSTIASVLAAVGIDMLDYLPYNTVDSSYVPGVQNTLSFDNVLNGGDVDDVIVGNALTDILAGNNGADYLEGGADSDILTGGIGDDELSGGTGADTYRFNPGDGLDHIIDAVNDNNDSILINADASAINLSSYQFHILDGAAGAPGLYQAEHTNPNAPRVTALFNGNGSSLTIDINGGSAAGGNTIVVDHFADGNFGIMLGEPEPVEAPDVEPDSYTVTAVDINRVGLPLSAFVDATYALRAARNEQAGVNLIPILLDAESVTWTNATSYAEAVSPSFVGAAGIYFDGGNANDQLVGGDRADEYDGWSGDDYIELRGSDDLASGGQGSDTILGGMAMVMTC